MNDAEESIWIERYFDLIKSHFSGTDYNEFTKYLFPTYGWNKNVPYLCCLSEIKDSLGQWRGYSSDGTGVAIGFTPLSDRVSAALYGLFNEKESSDSFM